MLHITRLNSNKGSDDMCRSREGIGGPDPLENHKAIGFLIITGLDPMENHKATKAEFNVGPPFK